MLLVVTADGRLLMHLRQDKVGVLQPGCWAGFSGAVELDESAEEALQRELLEEPGWRPIAVQAPTRSCEAASDMQTR